MRLILSQFIDLVRWFLDALKGYITQVYDSVWRFYVVFMLDGPKLLLFLTLAYLFCDKYNLLIAFVSHVASIFVNSFSLKEKYYFFKHIF